MAGGGSGGYATKDIVHNLGYKPIVRAFVKMSAYSVTGWREVPISYYVRVWYEDIGMIIEDRSITYQHIDNNTIRFYGDAGTEIKVFLYLEPREEAWYE